MGLGMSIMDWERFLKGINDLVEKEQRHLDWLYEKRIEVINKTRGLSLFGIRKALHDKAKNDIEEMIQVSELHLDHYQTRAVEYEDYIKNLKEL